MRRACAARMPAPPGFCDSKPVVSDGAASRRRRSNCTLKSAASKSCSVALIRSEDDVPAPHEPVRLQGVDRCAVGELSVEQCGQRHIEFADVAGIPSHAGEYQQTLGIACLALRECCSARNSQCTGASRVCPVRQRSCLIHEPTCRRVQTSSVCVCVRVKSKGAGGECRYVSETGARRKESDHPRTAHPRSPHRSAVA